MSPRLPVRLAAPLTVLALLVAGCSGGDDTATTPSAAPSPISTTPAPAADPCELTATVDGVSYHARGIYGDYEVDTSIDLTAPLSPCQGVAGEDTTFHPVVGVRRDWALVADHDGEQVFFITDKLPPIPADSAFAHILVGDFAD